MGVFSTHLFARLLIIVLFLLPVHALARQDVKKKITLVRSNITVATVFDAIEKQTGMVFSYSNRLIDLKRRVNVTFRQASLDEVLDSLLTNQGFTWAFRRGMISVFKGARAVTTSPLVEDSSLMKGKTLDETVIIGYGTTTPRLSTGNVYAVKAETISANPVSNPLLVLQGRVAGLEVIQTSGMFGTKVKLQIRGRNSLNNGTDPLLIVDGIPYNLEIAGGLGSFIFGAKASALSYINSGDIESIDVLKDADATAIYGARGANGVILITTKKGQAGPASLQVNISTGISNITHRADLLTTPEYLQMRREAFKNDKVTPTPGNASDLLGPDSGRYTDWQKALIGGTAHITQAQLAVSGGSTQMQYLLSGNYRRETTVFPGNFNDVKGGAHFSISGASADQRFKTTLTGSFLVDQAHLPAYDFVNSITVAPNAPAGYNADGSLNYGWLNPYISLVGPLFTANVQNLFSNAAIQYEILPGLILKANLGYHQLWGNGLSVIPIALRAPDQRKGITGSSTTNRYVSTSQIAEPQLTYTDTLGGGRLEVLAGGTLQDYKEKGEVLNAQGYKDDAFLGNLSYADTIAGTSTATAYKYAALFGRIGYNWQDRYLLNVSVRNDGSSRFGPSKRRAFFASVGAGWIFSNEKFAQPVYPFLSYGKLRVSYGTTGNDQIGDYEFMDRYTNVVGSYQGATGLEPVSLKNADFAWELTRKLEVGLETGFLNDRIMLSSSYYRYRSTNQLVNFPLADLEGASSILGNIPAVIGNDGIEFVLTTQNIQSPRFVWTTSYNISLGRNKLLYYPGTVPNGNLVGESLSLLYVREVTGVDPKTGTYLFADGNGNSIPAGPAAARTFPVNTEPSCYGGMQNSVRYRQLQLDIFFQFTKQQGLNDIYDPTYIPGFPRNQYHAAIDQHWQKTNDVSQQQKFSQNSQLRNSYNMALQGSLGYTDASFIRCKNVSLTWNFPYRKLGVKDCKLYLQAQNLFTITKYPGMDPETQSRTAIPPLRVINTGIQMTF
jgi:TonB-linked SusC/RagA family outer membrane protein